MNQRLNKIAEALATTVANGASYTGEWRSAVDWPALVGSITTTQTITVKIQQSNDGSTVCFEELVSDVQGGTTVAANKMAGFRFARVAPLARIYVSNASGATATATTYLYGSN